jgi:hypothetical protein
MGWDGVASACLIPEITPPSQTVRLCRRSVWRAGLAGWILELTCLDNVEQHITRTPVSIVEAGDIPAERGPPIPPSPPQAVLQMPESKDHQKSTGF